MQQPDMQPEEESIFDAAKKGDLEEVKAMVEQDPEVVHSVYKSMGWTPLHFASFHGHAPVSKTKEG